ncbi:MAG: hypothetical protein BWY76_02504 [bacterium ADurb.Bin429]|nr:MAG: hypothetical protein BWY76_02504 [bacterium ADurb.Bin429]
MAIRIGVIGRPLEIGNLADALPSMPHHIEEEEAMSRRGALTLLALGALASGGTLPPLGPAHRREEEARPPLPPALPLPPPPSKADLARAKALGREAGRKRGKR